MPPDSGRSERLLKIHWRTESTASLRRFFHRQPDTQPETRRTYHRGNTGTTARPDGAQNRIFIDRSQHSDGRSGRNAEYGIHRQHQRYPCRCPQRTEHLALLGNHEPRNRPHLQELLAECQGDYHRTQERKYKQRETRSLYRTSQRQICSPETHCWLLPANIWYHFLPYP